VDVVDLQDWVARVGQILDIAGTARVFAVTLAAEYDGVPGVLMANRDRGGPGRPLVVTALPVDVGASAEPLVLLRQRPLLLLGKRGERDLRGTPANGLRQAKFGEQLGRVGIGKIRFDEDVDGRGQCLR
jgi:hypothetical protein